MRIITCLAVVAILFGCDRFRSAPSPKGTPVSVGMAYQNAEPILTSAGAKHVEIDKIGDTDTHVVEVNEFPNEVLLLFKISKESRIITEIRVCTNQHHPGEDLVWQSVKTFYVGND